jgi:hypothetical protein
VNAPRGYADFQNLDDENRVRLTCQGTRDDLVRQGIELREGMLLTQYTDDADDEGRPDELRAQGIVQVAQDEQCWVAAVDWAALRHAPKDAIQDNGGSAENRDRSWIAEE